MSIQETIKQHGVTLTFSASNARLTLSRTTEEPNQRSIAMNLALESRQDVRLPDDRSLKNAQWSMYLIEDGSPGKYGNPEAVGVLSYLEEYHSDTYSSPEGCHFEVAINSGNFQTLLTSLQTGRISDWVSVKVQGLGFGWEPDGSGKVWDVKETPQAPVIDLSFGLPLTASQAYNSTDVDEDDIERSTLPASAADIFELRSTIVQQTTLVVNLLKSVIVIAIIALVLFLIHG